MFHPQITGSSFFSGAGAPQIPKMPLTLRLGQVMLAKVLATGQEQAVVQIGTAVFAAKLEATLSQGQHVWMRVQEEGPPARLKILALEKRAVVKKDGDLTSLLKALGVKNEKEMQELIRWAVRQELPLDPAVLQRLQDYAGGRFLQPQGYALALYWQTSAAVDPELLPLYVEAFQGPSFALSAEKWLQLFHQAPRTIDAGKFPELLQWSRQVEALQRAAGEVAPSFRFDLLWQKLSLDLDSVKESSRLPSFLPQLLQAVEGMSAEWHEAARSLRSHALTQVLMQQPFTDGSSYYWQFPLPFLQGEMQGKAMLKVPVDGGKAAPKADSFHFVAQLQLVRLGEMTVEIRAVERLVSVHLYQQKLSAGLQQQVEGATSWLEANLRTIGYALQAVHLHERKADKIASVLGMGEGIDIQV